MKKLRFFSRAGAVAALLLAMAMGASLARAAGDFLDPAEAFRLSARLLDAQRIELRFDIAPGYYLYRDKLSAATDSAGVVLAPPVVPPGKVKFDEAFGKDVEYFRDSVTMVVPVPTPGTTGFTLQVGNQGCADKGLCYPPMQRGVQVESGPAGMTRVSLAGAASEGGLLAGLGAAVSAVTSSKATPSGPPDGSAGSAGSSPATSSAIPASGLSGADERFSLALQSRNLLTVAGVFLLAGLLLSFTPCVLPMLPILSSIIVGQSEPVSKGRGFALALSYSLGMALVYTGFGIAAALVGGGLGAALQNAWVLGGFGLLMVLLSLSMFDVYELQLPQALHNGLSAWSGRFKGGRFAGVFVMGGLSAVIVSPCIAAPLAGALVYISQTRDVGLGAVALFALACGMSLPLLLVGLSAGALLPRSGGWMKHVKHFFGVVLLAVALWMVSPVIPMWLVMVLAALLLLACAVYAGAFEPLHGHFHPGRTLVKGLGLLLALAAAMQLVGAASGGRSLLQPLGHLAASARASEPTSSAAAGSSSPALDFQRVLTVAELEAAVSASSRPVMVDFYADWCVACKEFESFTLSDARVREKLAGMTLLRVDVTANSEHDKALLRKYHLFGPPALLFMPAGGGEAGGTRVIGYQSAPDFLAHLARIDGLLRPR